MRTREEWHPRPPPSAAKATPAPLAHGGHVEPQQPVPARSPLRSTSAAALCTLLGVGGCGAIVEPKDRVEVDVFSELLIVEDTQLADELPGREPESRPIVGFGELLETALGETTEGATLRWLSTWAEASESPEAVKHEVTCRWLRATPENECDAACDHCTDRRLTLARAPFTLIGIAYRPDLALASGELRLGEQECRLLFALTTDPRSRDPRRELPVALVLEYRLGAPPEAGWAQRFHALASQPDGLDYRRALSQLITDVVTEPSEVNLRLRDEAFANGQMLGWRVTARGVERTGLTNTVDSSQASQEELRALLETQRQQHPHSPPSLPSAWSRLSVSRTTPLPATGDPEVDAKLAVHTCQGCHADTRSLDGFHIAPGRVGRARVSSFLRDPNRTEDDDLARRADALRTLLNAASTLRSASKASAVNDSR